MTDLMSIAGLGAVSGARSMLGPALVAQAINQSSPWNRWDGLSGAIGSPTAVRALALLAAGELIADKLPGTPSRTGAFPLLGRLASGALLGAVLARDRRAASIAAGMLGAACGAFGFAALRKLASERNGVPNAAAGLGEDALVLAAGWLLTRGIRRAAVR